MLAIIAAILFALALLIDIANVRLGAGIEVLTIVIAGLLCLALHLAGVGAGWRAGWGGRVRR